MSSFLRTCLEVGPDPLAVPAERRLEEAGTPRKLKAALALASMSGEELSFPFL